MLVESTDDVKVALHDLGGTGQPILLVHANGFCARTWSPVADVLADRFHCWALDLRGHGDAVAPDDVPLGWERLGADVLAVVDHLAATGEQPSVAAGHSMGGAALLMAELARPGTFTRLYCYEPIVFPEIPDRPDGANPLAAGARRRRDRFVSREDAIANYSSKPPFDVLHPGALAAYVDHGFRAQPDGSVELKCRPETEARNFELGANHRTFDRLPEIASQVTVVAGERDSGQGPGIVAPMIAERLPHSTFTVEPGLGHFGPLEDPDRIAEAIATTLT